MNKHTEKSILKSLKRLSETSDFAKVSTLADYLKLPEKDRYNYGFYRTPYSMVWNIDGEKDEGWTAFYAWAKDKHFIQFFFREFLTKEARRISFRISEGWYYLKCFFWHKHNVIKFRDNPCWCDSDVKIEKCLEKIFLDYVEKECNGNLGEDDEYSNGVVAKQKQILEFFQKTKPALEAEIWQLEEDLYGLTPKIKRKSMEGEQARKKLESLESALKTAVTDNLIKIIEIRESLWT